MQRAGIRDMRIWAHKPAPHEVRHYGKTVRALPDINLPHRLSWGWISTVADTATFLARLFSSIDGEDAPPILGPQSLGANDLRDAGESRLRLGCEQVRQRLARGSLPGTTSLKVHTPSGTSWTLVLNTRSAL